MEWIEKVSNNITNAKIKVVDIDVTKNTVNYCEKIKQHRIIKSFKGFEEIVRAFLVNRLVNDLDYKPELIEIVFFASRNSPLLQNIFPGTGGEN